MTSAILEKLIDSELSWRENELALLKAQLLRDMRNASHFPVSYRSFITITYAHYEGFTKVVMAQAISDISQHGAAPSGCAESVQIALFSGALRKKIAKLSNTDLFQAMAQAHGVLDSIPFPTGEDAMEISNMNFSNFSDIVQCIGIDSSRFAGFRRHIGRLVDLRHRCAHGERLSFDSSKTYSDLAGDAFDLQSQMILLMHALALEVLNAFDGATFLIHSGSSTGTTLPP